LTGLALVSAAIAAGAIVQGADFRVTFGGARVAGRAVSSFDHSNQLGSLCAMASMVTIGLIASARTARWRLAGAGLMLVLIGGQILTLSRGAWIGTVVGVVFLMFALPNARRALIALAIPFAIVAVLMFATSPDSTQIQVIGERFESLTVRSPYDDRPAIWSEAIREIVADPLTGQGPGNFPVASTRSSSEASTVSAYHAHNILLTWAAESGIPAALLIVGFSISLVVAASRARRRGSSRSAASDRAVMAGMAAALVALAAQGLVDYTLRNSVIFFAVWAIVGCLLATTRIEPEDEDEAVQEDRWWAHIEPEGAGAGTAGLRSSSQGRA
jgi:O-antigen ligase